MVVEQLGDEPDSALVRNPDSSQTSREVRKVPEADIASDLGLSSRQAARSLFTIQ